MKAESFKIFISESIGEVSAELMQPSSMKAMITLAHGAGADMNHQFMKALSVALADHNLGSVRFNFPYMEKRRRMPDPPAIAEKTVSQVIKKAHELFPETPLFGSGKSFGGRMTSQHISKQPSSTLKGVIFYGFPLHAVGKPSTERAAHLNQIKIPMLFLQGTKDALATLQLVKDVSGKLPTATLALFEGADHSFKIGKRALVVELAEKTSSWIDEL